ncbi:MAG: molybdate ABC transporter substrate-binding protein [Planctomycetes bacterium]|nr:molybdate ABC transporter substrate-binding protein [Planctomycetota bacterium]
MRTVRAIGAFATATAFAILGLGSCSHDDNSLVIFAAASLQGPFRELAESFATATGATTPRIHVAGTPQLVLQIREGACVDVFASADTVQMQRVVDLGRVHGDTIVFAKNKLVIVTSPGNPHGIRALEDLARDGLRVLLCGPDVPAGRYAREALANASISVRSVSDEPSVRSVAHKVALGEVDAGIVYATDAKALGNRVESVAIDPRWNVTATYVAANTDSDLGASFVRFLESKDAARILMHHGFETP